MSEPPKKPIPYRSIPVELTEQEIQDFIAHSDSDGSYSESDESDWDDLKEADLAEVEFLLNPPVAKADQSSFKRSLSSAGMQPSCSKTGLKDIGVDSLFGSATPSVNSIEISKENEDVAHLFGSGSDSDFELEGLDESENKQDGALSKYGQDIQASLSAAENKKKERLIERHVQQIFPNADNTKPDPKLSVSTALAACAKRRKSAIEALNKTSISYGSTPSNQPSKSTRQLSQGATTSNTNTHPGSSVSGDCWIAKPTSLRVYRSIVSSELWSNRTSDRQVLNLAQLMRRCRTGMAQLSAKQSIVLDESVVVGVIGSKLEPRRSRNDRIYSVWCLSDLENVGPGACEGCVRLMLFGQCHEKLWKEAEGTVVAILNPRILSSNAASSNGKDITLTLDSPLHVMILGQSPDYGICSATVKSGQKCFHIINKNVCRYCDYHVKKAYYEASSTRPGFVTSNLTNPKLSVRSRYSGDLAPVSDPSVYTLPIRPDVQTIGPRKRIQLTMSKLTAAGYEVDLSTGLGGNSNKSKDQSQTQVTAIESSVQMTKKINEAEEKLIAALRKPSAGSLNLLKHLQDEPSSSNCSTTSTNREDKQSEAKKRKLTDNLTSSKPSINRSTSFKDFFASMSAQRKSVATDPGAVTTTEYIDLGPVPEMPSIAISGARLRAINFINSQGGVKALDDREKSNRTSSVIAKSVDNRNDSSPLSRILGDATQKNSGNSQTTPGENKNPIGEDIALKDKKRLRLERLRNLSLEVKQGSAHAHLVDELEHQTEDARLANLEKRDQFEQKLLNQTEEACTFVCCETCNYRAFKAAPDCLKNNHTLKYRKGHKRYFRCRHCQKRTISLDRYPKKSCANCGESLFEKTGVMAERKGPKLPHENLLPRGLEEKFLG